MTELKKKNKQLKYIIQINMKLSGNVVYLNL